MRTLWFSAAMMEVVAFQWSVMLGWDYLCHFPTARAFPAICALLAVIFICAAKYIENTAQRYFSNDQST